MCSLSSNLARRKGSQSRRTQSKAFRKYIVLYGAELTTSRATAAPSAAADVSAPVPDLDLDKLEFATMLGEGTVSHKALEEALQAACNGDNAQVHGLWLFNLFGMRSAC
jgi:hypothetical protein